jgi:hypothetical protein
MKELVITGLAQETSLNGRAETKVILVINGGDLRLEVSEKAAEDLLKYAYSDQEENTSTAEPEQVPPSDEEDEEEEEEPAARVSESGADEHGIAQL